MPTLQRTFAKKAQICNKASCCIAAWSRLTTDLSSIFYRLKMKLFRKHFENHSKLFLKNPQNVLNKFQFQTTKNLVDNQFGQAGFRPLCNKIPWFDSDYKNKVQFL